MVTRIHAFWIAGLLLALIDIPDFITPLRRISKALAKIAARRRIAMIDVVGRQAEAGEILEPRVRFGVTRTTSVSP
jgi:hypothetical protein